MPIPKRLLRGTTRETTIEHLFLRETAINCHPGERLIFNQFIPPWQRPEVWTIEQKRNFLESVFLGLNCGLIVCNGLDWTASGRKPMSGWVLDGQQRLTALREFIERGMLIFDDVTYHGISPVEKLRFHRKHFTRHELDYIDDESVLKELYNRLNFGGTSHYHSQRL
ncbi:DUF262 domain-containing protein [Hydrogenophaga sp. NFH-34]|uniref:DUF262 domain-containing protein n=1 Tax=Hydrogenophaga sp. NFH-34 TaxID=2744446 RepID=UPI001F2F6A75|nr:DUF262 domain-containing protein [Hydrogenophaga sp. NFH-34]